MLYSVNEIFYSIQGEGYHAGLPTHFIRLAGCNLNCSWCDTDKTLKERLIEEEIRYRLQGKSANVVITGGEPTVQDLFPLVHHLKECGWFVMLETNGTNISGIPKEVDWITMSPKVEDIPNGFAGDEIKVVLDGKIDPHIFTGLMFDFKHYYIQPLWTEEGCDTEPAINFVKENARWKLGLQTHKFINIK